MSIFWLPARAGSSYSKEEMERTLGVFAEQDTNYANLTTENFSWEVWAEHGLLVTKKNVQKKSFSCFDVTKGFLRTVDNKQGKGQWKYLGTTPEGYLVENPDYPADAYNGKPVCSYFFAKI